MSANVSRLSRAGHGHLRVVMCDAVCVLFFHVDINNRIHAQSTLAHFALETNRIAGACALIALQRRA